MQLSAKLVQAFALASRELLVWTCPLMLPAKKSDDYEYVFNGNLRTGLGK